MWGLKFQNWLTAVVKDIWAFADEIERLVEDLRVQVKRQHYY